MARPWGMASRGLARLPSRFSPPGSGSFGISRPSGKEHDRDFALDARTEELREELLAFMDSHVYPAEPVFAEQLSQLENRWAWDSAPVLAELLRQARKRGLWNLVFPGEH